MKSIYQYMLISCFAVVTLLPNIAIAQQEPACANEVFQNLLFKDSTFMSAFNDVNKAMAENKNNQRITAGNILEIPIVIHVLNLGEPVGTGTNISDDQILEAIRGANERWRKITTVGVDMEVQFCLAQFDPNGNPSTGIVRKDASVLTNYSQYGISYIGALGQPGADETTVKNFSNWNHSFVFNIWVVKDIAGDFGGYAYIPFGFNYPTDGVVITYNAMRYSSSTFAHELGHGMGLFHTFQGNEAGCVANDLCFIQGDWVCDTPPHKQTDCVSTTCAANATDSMLNLSFKNVMSYCGGRNLFTQGQKTRVRDVINTTSRKQLLTSYACSGPPCDTARTQLAMQTCDSTVAGIRIDTLLTSKGCDSIIKTVTTFIPLPIAAFNYVMRNDSVQFFNQSQHANNYVWNFGNDSTSIATSPIQQYNGSGNYEVSLIAENDCGADTTTQTIIIPIITSVRNNNKSVGFTLYPNPSNGTFTVKTDVSQNDTYLEIINMLGQKIFTQKLSIGKEHNITLENNLAKGIYQIQIKTNNAVIGSNLLSIY